MLSLLLPLSLMAQENRRPDTLHLTQGQALELAYEQNYSLQIAQLEIKNKETAYRSQFGRLLPTVDLNGTYNHTLKKQRMYFGSEDSPMAKMFPEEGIEIGMTHNIQAGVRAGMPLIVPQLWASLGLSRKGVEQAVEEARSSKIKLKTQVRKAYIALLLAQNVERVLAQSLKNIQTSYEQAQEKYSRGLIAEYDLLRLETQAKNLKPELIQAQQNIHLSEMKLKILLNLGQNQMIILTDKLLDYKDYIYKNELIKARDKDLANNLLLKKIDLQSESLSAGLKTKQMSFMPSLSLNFLYNYNYANNSLDLDKSKRWSPYSMIGLTLSVPLFSGGSRYYDVRGIELQLNQLRLQRLQAQRAVSLALEQALSQLRSSREQFFASELAEVSASRGLAIAQARYENGLSSLLELNDAELSHRQAQLNLNQAIYNYLLAKYQIEELRGIE